jgi:hypothetical protein
VRIDELGQPQRTSHARGSTANDHNIGRHLGTFETFNRFAEDQHSFRVSGFELRVFG